MASTPAGQHWRKIDLHVHTPGSKDYVGPAISAAEFVERVLGMGVDAIAVTDHNSGEWIDSMKDAARRRLVVFPGVEVTVTGGKEGSVHLIALFDTAASTKTVENLLAKLGFDAAEYGSSSAVSPKSPEEAIQIIKKAGGLPLLAHADSSKGVLHDMKGQPRNRIMNRPELAGVEVKDVDKHRKLLDGHDKYYRRALAVYRASDNRSADDTGHHVEGVATRFSYFKMDVINLEGLRQCFCDPDVRILTDADVGAFPAATGPRIDAVVVSKGFLKGRFEFHEALNCVIGGKGVGKSLLVELTRFALEQPSAVPAIVEDQQLKLERQLGRNGLVSVEVTTAGGQQLAIARQYDGKDNPITIVDIATGKPVEGNAREIFPVTAYSQTEAIEIARDSDAQLHLIDSMPDLAPLHRKMREVTRDLADSDHQVADAVEAEGSAQEARKDLATVKQQIGDLDKLLKSKEYEEYKSTETRTVALTEILDVHREFSDTVENALRECGQIRLWTVPAELTKDKKLQSLAAGLKALAKEFQAGLKGLRTTCDQSRKAADSEEKAWGRKVAKKRAAYEAWAKEAGGQHHELLKKRERLKKQKAELEKQLDDLSETAGELPRLKKARERLLDELDQARAKVFALRKKKYEEITKGTGGRLKLEIVQGANRTAFSQRLIQICQGSYARREDIKELVGVISPRDLFWSLFEDDVDGLITTAKVRRDLAERIVKSVDGHEPEEILSLQYELLVEDVPEIKLRKDDGKYYGLDGLSIGQKCTALLIVALSGEDRPILVDQPEDALDIASVYVDITTQIRKRKSECQFILTTHNPTVAVAGDADKFLILRATATEGRLSVEGAIERGTVKEEVILHLEGGPEPFGLKTRKYGQEGRVDA